MSLKDKWTKVGHDFKTIGRDAKDARLEGRHFAELGRDLGRSIISSVKVGVDAAENWAESGDAPSNGNDGTASRQTDGSYSAEPQNTPNAPYTSDAGSPYSYGAPSDQGAGTQSTDGGYSSFGDFGGDGTEK